MCAYLLWQGHVCGVRVGRAGTWPECDMQLWPANGWASQVGVPSGPSRLEGWFKRVPASANISKVGWGTNTAPTSNFIPGEYPVLSRVSKSVSGSSSIWCRHFSNWCFCAGSQFCVESACKPSKSGFFIFYSSVVFLDIIWWSSKPGV